MVKKAGKALSMALGVSFAAAAAGLSGCASDPSKSFGADCMETKETRLFGKIISSSREYSSTCAAAQATALLADAVKEEGTTESRALIALFGAVQYSAQKSEKDRKDFEKVLLQAGISPQRILKVSLMFAPVGKTFAEANCRAPEFGVDTDGNATMSIGCFKGNDNNKAPASPPLAVPQTAPAIAAP